VNRTQNEPVDIIMEPSSEKRSEEGIVDEDMGSPQD
jgi:hypothetical protein